MTLRQAQGERNTERSITIAILAMGGEGGGVLADWLVDLAEHNGYFAQTTSVPGVAQRTGATVYYLEMFPEAATPAGSLPVMALGPVPGEVDVVLASELMEAGRALQRGLVSPARTTFIASTHRVYSMTERTAMGDGRVDADKLMAGAAAAAKKWIHADFAQLADQTGSLIAPALYGALAASGCLPFSREQFEATITRGGVGVVTSLKAFAAGYVAGFNTALVSNHTFAAEKPEETPMPKVGVRLAALAERIHRDFPSGSSTTLVAGIIRMADYQDVAYAARYLDQLMPVVRALPKNSAVAHELLDETARHLALWMSYEDTVRVADLKTRRTRFGRVGDEVKISPTQHLGINEFLHPRIEEIADTLPAAWGRWLLKTSWAQTLLRPFTNKGRVVQTSSIRGYLLLYAIAALRPMRPKSLRFGIEQQRISDWLKNIVEVAQTQPASALEVARMQSLVKGYGDTHARGWNNYSAVMAAFKCADGRIGPAALRELRDAALADEHGHKLSAALAQHALV